MKIKGKVAITILMIISILGIGGSCDAHQGRTDRNGGHKDNNNKSGLGSYHYHCGGHEAHLHTNGVCPYSTNSSNSKKSNSTKTTKPVQEAKKETIIEAEDITINEKIEKIKVGESFQLTVTILPNNCTNNTVKWETSSPRIATVDASGKLEGKSSGTVETIASTSNGKIDKKSIIIEKEVQETTNIVQTSINNKETLKDTKQNETSSPVGGLLALGILGAGGYGIYKVKKK